MSNWVRGKMLCTQVSILGKCVQERDFICGSLLEREEVACQERVSFATNMSNWAQTRGQNKLKTLSTQIESEGDYVWRPFKCDAARWNSPRQRWGWCCAYRLRSWQNMSRKHMYGEVIYGRNILRHLARVALKLLLRTWVSVWEIASKKRCL